MNTYCKQKKLVNSYETGAWREENVVNNLVKENEEGKHFSGLKKKNCNPFITIYRVDSYYTDAFLRIVLWKECFLKIQYIEYTMSILLLV